MSIAVQLETIAAMSACGALMGMGYDTYQLFRQKRRVPTWLVFLLDLGFWLTSAFLIFSVLQKLNDGIVRWPMFLAMLGGAWVYFVLVRKMYTALLLTVIRFIQWLYYTILTVMNILLVKPILLIYRLIALLVGFLLLLLRGIGSFLWRLILFVTNPFAKWGRQMGKGFGRAGAGVWAQMKKWWLRKKQG